MRVLFLDANFRCIDPTAQRLPVIYKAAAETHLYGPGYQSPAVLDRGVEAYVDRHGPFDVVTITDALLYHPVFPAVGLPSRHRAFPLAHLAYGGPLRDYFFRHRGPKIASLLQSDYYNFGADRLAILRRARDGGAWFLGYGEQLVPWRADMPHLADEIFAATVNDGYRQFIAEAPERIIPLVTALAETEFWWTPLTDRPQGWSVPGAPYRARQQARTALGLTRRVTPFQVYSALAALGLRPFQSRLGLEAYQTLFAHDLERTRYVYTCGSALGQPCRKFFEIPAKGCVLVGRPFHGAHHLGFVDGVTMIAREPHDLADLSGTVTEDEAQALADAGRDLIWHQHRVAARGHQLASVLEALAHGTFAGAAWQNGAFHVSNG